MQVSMFLYHKAHYVYNWGVGESYFMEILAIVVVKALPCSLFDSTLLKICERFFPGSCPAKGPASPSLSCTPQPAPRASSPTLTNLSSSTHGLSAKQYLSQMMDAGKL